MLKLSFGMLVLSGVVFGADLNRHAPIVIQSDQDFTNCGCVLSGTGSLVDPYIIGPWAINMPPSVAVMIDGTSLTKSFVLRNLVIAGNGSSSSIGIVLNHINGISASVQGRQTLIQSAGIGILVENS